MNNSTFEEIFGQEVPNKRPKLVRRRLQLSTKNNNFLNEMENLGCDANTIVNMALNTFIPKTYNSNFDLTAIIKMVKT